MSGRLAGKVAVVVGAGTEGGGLGNGKAAAILFAREGAALHLVDRDAAAVEETAEAVRAEGGRCTVALADATDEAALRRAMEGCVAAHGGLHVLHNNVGAAIPGGPEEVSLPEFEAGFRLNVGTALLASRCAAALMGRGGAIVNVGSISGLRVLEGLAYVAYPVAKSALSGLTRVLAATWGPRGIRVNAVLPGFILSPMVERAVLRAAGGMTLDDYLAKRAAAIPLGRWGDPWDVAEAALYLASDAAKYVTGAELVVDGGATLLAG